MFVFTVAVQHTWFLNKKIFLQQVVVVVMVAPLFSQICLLLW